MSHSGNGNSNGRARGAAPRGSWLAAHARNVYSQTGEDGILEQLVALIPDRTGVCVEFGAWDGRHLSNTFNLIAQARYRGYLIEGDAQRFRDLQQTAREYPGIQPINAWVDLAGENTLDNLLARAGAPERIDVLSIDIDGNDYHVWASVERTRPYIVVIEYNPTMPTFVHYVQPAGADVAHGSSLAALSDLGRRKGYELAAVTEWNAIFVEAELYPRLGIDDNSPEALRPAEEYVTYLLQGFDGSLILHGNTRLLWHALDMDAERVQMLPARLRGRPDGYSLWQKVWLRLLRWRRRHRSNS